MDHSVQFTKNKYLIMKGDNSVEVNLVKVPHFYGSFEVDLQSNQDDLTEDNNHVIHFEGGELTKTVKIQISNATENFKVQLKDPTNDIALGEKPVIDISLVGKFYRILQFYLYIILFHFRLLH